VPKRKAKPKSKGGKAKGGGRTNMAKKAVKLQVLLTSYEFASADADALDFDWQVGGSGMRVV
jgi:hypothetical protein